MKKGFLAGKVALVAGRKSYNQNCPIAKSLDIVGERWTLLILRELLGGSRRYSDLRAELPGIATNLLAERLKELHDAGLVDRAELPPPIARTVYSLSEVGWQRVPAILRSIAWLGLERLDLIEAGELAHQRRQAGKDDGERQRVRHIPAVQSAGRHRCRIQGRPRPGD